METTQVITLTEYLKLGTESLHSQLDKHIISYHPFSDAEHYQAFLRMQLRLHTAVEPLYQDEVFEKILPDLKLRSRLSAVVQDCADLAVSDDLKAIDTQVAQTIHVDNLYRGLGWLYTLEGSTLGAAMLLKHVKQSLALSETFGAHHMAAHADGRATHWRAFKAMLDAIELDGTNREQVLEGAQQAFTFALAAVNELMTIDVNVEEHTFF